jgi:hypothetical protein
MEKRGKLASPEMSKILDHLTGIPQGKEEEALAIQVSAQMIKAQGPVESFGIWVGGCYYIRDKNGNVKGKHGTYRLVACVA